MSNTKYYMGLDPGTDSVGWATSDKHYNIIRKKGKSLWGVRLFDGAETAAKRRVSRIQRRRLKRMKGRIDLLQELFAEEVAKVDETFFIRLNESNLHKDDKTVASAYHSYILLNGCHFASPEVTEKLFNQMEEVGRFRITPDKVIHQMQGLAVHDKEVMLQNVSRISAEANARKINLAAATKTKERVSGEFRPTGELISFNREWAEHRFTDIEVAKLLAGEDITIQAKSPKTKKMFTCVGNLQHQEFEDKKGKKVPFWGFKCQSFVETGDEKEKIGGIYVPTGEAITFSRVWSGHRFTDMEVKKLLTGEIIEFSAMSKRKKLYVAKGKLEEQEYKKHKFWGFKLSLD